MFPQAHLADEPAQSLSFRLIGMRQTPAETLAGQDSRLHVAHLLLSCLFFHSFHMLRHNSVPQRAQIDMWTA